MTDLAIIGSGPAAMSAAIYAARADLSVVVYERGAVGGALTQIAHLANYPGFDGSGADFAAALSKQVKDLDVKIIYDEILDLEDLASKYRAVLIATGSEPRKLSFVPSAPVSYCALCDGPLYKDKNILVIGGGNSAVGESLLLADLAKSLTLMTHSELKAEATRIDELRAKPNVKIIEDTEPTPENTSGYDGIFLYVGKRPASSLVAESFRDSAGYITTQSDTSHCVTDNIFVAGDVRSGSIKQIITAAADGASAAIEITTYLKEQNV